MNSGVSFQSVSRSRLVDDVVAQLQKKISSGEMKCGDKLPTEPELMKQFGVGRSTVREAVRVLVHANLLEKKQGFGTFLKTPPVIQEPLVSRLRRAEIVEVFEVRKMFEPGIAKLAADRRSADDLERMRVHLAARLRAWEAGDTNAFVAADVEFHMAVAVASQNAVAIDLYRTFTTVMQEAMSRLWQLENESHHEFHEKLYEAIDKRNGQDAVDWTNRNLDLILDKIMKREP